MENIYSDKYFEATVSSRVDNYDRETGEEIQRGELEEVENIHADSLGELKKRVWMKYEREDFELIQEDISVAHLEDSFYESVCESNWLKEGEEGRVLQYETLQIRFYEKTLTQLIIKE